MPTELIDTRLTLPDPTADFPKTIGADLSDAEGLQLGAGLLNPLAVLHVDQADPQWDGPA